MPKYRKKPVEVEAVQWTGKNLKDVMKLNQGAIREKNGRLYVQGLEMEVGDYIVNEAGWVYSMPEDVFKDEFKEVK